MDNQEKTGEVLGKGTPCPEAQLVARDAAEEKIEAAAERRRKIEQMQEETLLKIASGTLKLATPIRSGGADVTELQYDFGKMTGLEYADAMDSDKKSQNMFVMTQKQALALFAKAAGKANKGMDETDILERLGGVDAMEATQLAMYFFKVSAQIKNRRTSAA